MTQKEILTLEEKILQKIMHSKEIFKQFKDLNDISNSKGVSFLQRYIHDIYHAYEEELKEMRLDLCKSRGE